MKTYCKRVNIEDPDVIYPWVLQAFDGKWRDRDFMRLLCQYGECAPSKIRNEVAQQDYTTAQRAVYAVAVEIALRIQNRELALAPLRMFERLDGISGKIRQLCKSSAMQQCMDYVAVGAMGELFAKKIQPFQCASIEGRGQNFGKRHLENWIRRDKKSRYVRKGDINKCFASITANAVHKMLSRDIHKNKTLLWFTTAIVQTHSVVTTGLAIGSYLSQWLCNYMLSSLYRHLDGLAKIRKKRDGSVQRRRLVRHIMFYMDDFVITGTREADVEKAMREAVKFANEQLGLTIKSSWGKIDLKHGSIDMMGFVIGYHCTTIRRRIFKRLRRQFLRAAKDIERLGYVPLFRARKIASYKGYFVHTNCRTAARNLDVWRVCRYAAKSISYCASAQRKEIPC